MKFITKKHKWNVHNYEGSDTCYHIMSTVVIELYLACGKTQFVRKTVKSAAYKSIYFATPTLWNNPPPTPRSSKTIDNFKYKLENIFIFFVLIEVILLQIVSSQTTVILMEWWYIKLCCTYVCIRIQFIRLAWIWSHMLVSFCTFYYNRNKQQLYWFRL